MDSLNFDPRKTALILIDLQAGIVGRPLVPHSADVVVQNSVQIAQRLKAAGGIVVGVNVAFSAGAADRLQQPVDAPMGVPPGGFPAGFSDLAPAVASLPPDVLITKRQWGAFHGTELDLQLRRRGIDTILLGGVATNFGVESTAREAWQHNYAVVIVEDACASMGADLHQFAIEKILPRLALVRSTAQVLGQIPMTKAPNPK